MIRGREGENAYVFFAFEGDRGCLTQAIRAIRFNDPAASVSVFSDSSAPVAGLEPMVEHHEETFFDRQVNLNGHDCVMGMCDVMNQTVERFQPRHLIKIDCDTIAQFKSSENWGEFDMLGSSFYEGICFGPCYVLNPEILPEVYLQAKILEHDFDLVPWEDQAMSQIVRNIGTVKMVPYDAPNRFLAGFDYVKTDHPLERYRDHCDALTFGNRVLIDEDEPRLVVARAMEQYLDFVIRGSEFAFSCAASYKNSVPRISQ